MILRDPVHGLISFDSPVERIVVDLLDCREVQRLRRIKALGLASLAFPGAEHSRFAHAVGSAHVMKRYLERVRKLSTDLPAEDRIDRRAAMAALAAALLHDVGHGPLSHTFETVLPGAPPHETWTSRIILDPATDVHRVLTKVDPELPQEVERLVHGKHRIPHLARAVSGTFDVDRCDYLVRDSYMTGVRYGLLDIEWLLASLRLHRPQGTGASVLAVDGNKGLTAVEGFFLARLYMYRQVYLHKAVRGAEIVVRALFHRLVELGPQPGTPTAMATLLRGEPLDVPGYLRLDDRTLDAAIDAYTESSDPLLRELALRIRDRQLFKTMQLRADADPVAAQQRLDQVLRDEGIAPAYLGVIDRNEIRAYDEDHTLGVVGTSHGQYRSLLAASPVLRGLSRERFVHIRAVFPPQVRRAVGRGLAAFS